MSWLPKKTSAEDTTVHPSLLSPVSSRYILGVKTFFIMACWDWYPGQRQKKRGGTRQRNEKVFLDFFLKCHVMPQPLSRLHLTKCRGRVFVHHNVQLKVLGKAALGYPCSWLLLPLQARRYRIIDLGWTWCLLAYIPIAKLHSESVNIIYFFVAGFLRPVVIFGPIADVAREKLAREEPDLFELASMFVCTILHTSLKI